MTPERRKLIESIFESAARLSYSGRRTFLDSACASDTSLRAELDLHSVSWRRRSGCVGSIPCNPEY